MLQLVALAGTVLAVLRAVTLREPPRVLSDGLSQSGPAAARYMLGCPVIRHMVFATNLVLAVTCSAITWIPAYLIRVRAMDTLMVGKARTLLSLLSFWTAFRYLMSARRPGASYRTNEPAIERQHFHGSCGQVNQDPPDNPCKLTMPWVHEYLLMWHRVSRYHPALITRRVTQERHQCFPAIL